MGLYVSIPFVHLTRENYRNTHTISNCDFIC